MKLVIGTYKVIRPSFLSFSSDTELDRKADKFAKAFENDKSPLFCLQIQSVRRSFKSKIDKLI